MRLATSPCINALPPIAWEECSCLLCGSASYTPLLEASDPLAGLRFLIAKCERCGLCFTNPRPDPVSIKQFYRADYPCHRRVRETHRRLPRCVARTLQARGPARLLDFGCGAGGFLRQMHALGWNVTGLDMAESAVARIHELGMSAFVGTLPHPLWTSECFEAITMWQALEHVHQPLDVLHAAYRMLTPGGRLLVAVPNFAGFGARWFGANWYGLDLPRHLTHFTPATLRMMLGRAGFDHVELETQQHHSWIRHSARGGFLKTRLGAGLAGWWGRLTGRAESLLAIATKG